MTFNERYAKLNDAQKEAVNHIYGPLMVIAGPGTGKTELLSMRTANILNQTDTLAENILCLTFTESGVNAMRERLIEIIGKDAYKVAIHTFHGFGTEIINQNGEFFYNGADFRPGDELTTRQILEKIFSDLPHDNSLSSKHDSEYTYLKDAESTVSEFKKSGLTSDELISILDANVATIQKANQLLAPIFDNKINIKMIEALKSSLEPIAQTSNRPRLPSFKPLAEILVGSLGNAIEIAEETGSTKSITAWKNAWMQKNSKNEFELKATARQDKLRDMAVVYEKYLLAMQTEKLYDFDDMILRVIQATEKYPELRYNLQERYQFIMIDEFQDTNLAQMRLVHSLIDSDVAYDEPNIMVVGDDDQAIYSFQGADISNILSFKENYPKTKFITLKDNYRSGKNILEPARQLILQGQDRLEHRLKEVNKELKAQNDKNDGSVTMFNFANLEQERFWIVKSIKQQIQDGIKPNQIAVIGRKHYQITELLPYFAHLGVAVRYDKQENILQQPPIEMLHKISTAVLYLAKNRHDDLNNILPEILSNPAWNINKETLIELSLQAYKDHKYWIEAMDNFETTKSVKDFLVELSLESTKAPVEQMLDKIMGIGKTDDFISPLKNYYFSEDIQKQQPHIFINYINGLRLLRRKLKEYKPNLELHLEDFVEFVDAHNNARVGIELTDKIGSADGVNLMTAHGSKGLEFDYVYIYNASDSVWGTSARGSSRKINYPENMPLKPAGDSDDEKLRLFYVAMTRAKEGLFITYSDNQDEKRKKNKAEFLLEIKTKQHDVIDNTDPLDIEERALIDWQQPIIDTATNLKSALSSVLESYRLSATHLNNFIDITSGGPQKFFMSNLLRFPEAMSPSAAYGSSIHHTLNLAHQNILAGNPPEAIEDILSKFQLDLSRRHLSETDYKHYLKKGFDSLEVFLNTKYNKFSTNQKTEIDFRQQNSLVEDALLTGKIDLIEFRADKTIGVTDYKTGKATQTWKARTTYEGIKLHKYRQQLLFYKLMIESSRDYSKYDIESLNLCFIEPNKDKEILELSIDLNTEELEHIKKLIIAVWRHIKDLNLPDISKYSKTLEGIKQFEQDLIDDIV